MECNVTFLTRFSLLIVALLDIFPGLVHFLAEDGGAGSIAGIVLEWDNATSIKVGEENWNTSNYHKQTVLVMFSALGLIQIKLGFITMLMALLMPQSYGNDGIMLYRLTLTLVTFQIFKIIVDLFGYRNIHLIAPFAPGGYKPYLNFSFLCNCSCFSNYMVF